MKTLGTTIATLFVGCTEAATMISIIRLSKFLILMLFKRKSGSDMLSHTSDGTTKEEQSTAPPGVGGSIVHISWLMSTSSVQFCCCAGVTVGIGVGELGDAVGMGVGAATGG